MHRGEALQMRRMICYFNPKAVEKSRGNAERVVVVVEEAEEELAEAAEKAAKLIRFVHGRVQEAGLALKGERRQTMEEWFPLRKKSTRKGR